MFQQRLAKYNIRLGSYYANPRRTRELMSVQATSLQLDQQSLRSYNVIRAKKLQTKLLSKVKTR